MDSSGAANLLAAVLALAALVSCGPSGSVADDGRDVAIGAAGAPSSLDAAPDVAQEPRDGLPPAPDGTIVDEHSPPFDAGDAYLDVAVDTPDAPLDVVQVADGPSCGDPGQPCCPNDVCHDEGCCREGHCVSSASCRGCGGAHEPCCPYPWRCGAGLLCDLLSTCEPCGGPNQPCCEHDSCDAGGCCFQGGCRAEGSSCWGSVSLRTYGVCKAGQCICGELGEECCLGERECAQPASTCVSQMTPDYSPLYLCESCGGPDQACCPGNACRDGACCVAVLRSTGEFLSTCRSRGSSCGFYGSTVTCDPQTSSCGGCGGLGQSCCDGGYPPNGWCSAPGTSCFAPDAGSTTCVACGKLGQRCCQILEKDVYKPAPLGTCEELLRCEFLGSVGYGCVGPL